jgi:hypothetical protein
MESLDLHTLYKMLQKVSIPIKQNRSNRRGFPKHRATTFGITRARYSGKVGPSWATLRWPHIWEEIQKIGNHLNFEFTSVQVNHNVCCPLHKDTNNVGDIILDNDISGEVYVFNGGKIICSNGSILIEVPFQNIDIELYSVILILLIKN